MLLRSFDRVLVCESCDGRHFVKNGEIVHVRRSVDPSDKEVQLVPIPADLVEEPLSNEFCVAGTKAFVGVCPRCSSQWVGDVDDKAVARELMLPVSADAEGVDILSLLCVACQQSMKVAS